LYENKIKLEMKEGGMRIRNFLKTFFKKMY
jgi:hypothetical protein